MRLFKVEKAWDGPGEMVGANGLEVPGYRCVFVDPETPFVQVGDCSLPLSKGLVEDLSNHGSGPQPLLAATLTPPPPLPEDGSVPPPRKLTRPPVDEMKRIRAGSDFGPALVHVCVPPYPGGRVRFRSTMFVEKVVEGRHCNHIEREYLWLTEGEGLTVVAMRPDEQEALIEFLPRAALRIEHEDAFVPEGESPALVVTWSGKELRVFRPQKFQGGARAKAYRRK